jgi:hypothetical protein
MLRVCFIDAARYTRIGTGWVGHVRSGKGSIIITQRKRGRAFRVTTASWSGLAHSRDADRCGHEQAIGFIAISDSDARAGHAIQRISPPRHHWAVIQPANGGVTAIVMALQPRLNADQTMRYEVYILSQARPVSRSIGFNRPTDEQAMKSAAVLLPPGVHGQVWQQGRFIGRLVGIGKPRVGKQPRIPRFPIGFVPPPRTHEPPHIRMGSQAP